MGRVLAPALESAALAVRSLFLRVVRRDARYGAGRDLALCCGDACGMCRRHDGSAAAAVQGNMKLAWISIVV